MAKTANDIVQKALRNLNVIASGETASDEDYQDAYEEYLVTHERLKEDATHQFGARRLYWGSNGVPDAIWTLVAAVLAVDLLRVFSVTDKINRDVVAHGERAETQIQKHLISGRSKGSRFPKLPVNSTTKGKITAATSA